MFKGGKLLIGCVMGLISWNQGGMMIVETTSKVFVAKKQGPKRKPIIGSSNTLTDKANVKKELAALDLEAQVLINQILNRIEDG